MHNLRVFDVLFFFYQLPDNFILVPLRSKYLWSDVILEIRVGILFPPIITEQVYLFHDLAVFLVAEDKFGDIWLVAVYREEQRLVYIV